MIARSREYYENESLCKTMLNQEQAHLELVDVLRKRIKLLEERVELAEAVNRYGYRFFWDKRPDLIPEYVEFAYEFTEDAEFYGEEFDPKLALKEAISPLHEETYDLSTIPCASKDFKPWND